MITSLIEMLQLQNMVTWTDLHSKYVFLKRPWVAKFTDIIKIPMILIKTTYEDPNRSTDKKYKEKILQNIFLSVSVCVCFSACLNIAKVNHFFWENSNCSKYQLVSHVIYTFLCLFYVRYNSVKFLSLLDMCNKLHTYIRLGHFCFKKTSGVFSTMTLDQLRGKHNPIIKNSVASS